MRPQRQPTRREELEAAGKKALELAAQGQYQAALHICLQTTRRWPQVTVAWTDAAVYCIKLARWEEALHYARQSLAFGGNTLALFDALSHAATALHRWPDVQRYGLHALMLRDKQFAGPIPIAHALPSLPPPPAPDNRQRNIIAFALFGNNAKYCETAILNAIEQPAIYPDWTCRFYLDESVPADVIARLRQHGGEVVYVDPQARQWPGPMWRFLALNDPQAQRIIFRDADSVISHREASAVAQWVASGKHFHAMRDSGTHTELLLAGLWGVTGGALPSLDALSALFFAAPLTSRHFADQYFLRQMVWPYARQSLMQHDSLFGFLAPEPFPDGPMSTDFHVGFPEGAATFSLVSPFPDGSQVNWTLWRHKADKQQQICCYQAQVHEGKVTSCLPKRYTTWIREGSAHLTITLDEPISAAHSE